MSGASFYSSEELTGHRTRLAAIRPRIDSSTPSSYFVLINRAKKDQLLSDWAHGVDAANLALLSRMTAIANTQPAVDDHRAVTEDRERRHREQSDADRRREQKRIEEENARMIERLQAQKSNYGASNWQSHAAAYEKHIKEVRLRQMLIADPINAKRRIQAEKEQARAARQLKRTQKLKPLPGQAAAGAGAGLGGAEYERDERGLVEEKEAAEAAEEDERRAGVEVGAFDEVDAEELLAADKAKSAGSVSLSEWMLPRNATHSPLHQDSHTIDSHHVILTIDEVNRTTARSDVPLGDDWTAFQTHPPAFLHAYLLRSYDLDSGLHSHLYLPAQALAPLGKAIERRLERVIALLGYTDDGELFFKRSLMPRGAGGDKKGAAGSRLYAGKRRAAVGERKEDRKVDAEPAKVADVKADVKMARREEKPKKTSKPVAKEQEKEKWAAPASKDAADTAAAPATDQPEEPTADLADSESTTQPTQLQAVIDVEQTQPQSERLQQADEADAVQAPASAEQPKEEEKQYEAKESEAPVEQQETKEQEPKKEQPKAAAAEPAAAKPAPTAVEEPVQVQQAAIEQRKQQFPAATEITEKDVPAQAQKSEPAEVVEASTQQGKSEQPAEPAGGPADAHDSAAVATTAPQQPEAVDNKADAEEKQAVEAQEANYAVDKQSAAQPPAVNASKPSSPPAALQTGEQQQLKASSKAGTPKAASPAHWKQAAAEEEKEAASALPTPKSITRSKPASPAHSNSKPASPANSISKPASPAVSAKAAVHLHRSTASPITGTRKVVPQQSSPRRHGAPTTH